MIKQGTDEWHKQRVGKFTASNFGKLFMGKETAGYKDLIADVVVGRLTGEPAESFKSDWMQRGNELESSARLEYMLQTGNKVRESGFAELDEWVGCSPDGLVYSDGLIEIKCPKASTLIKLHQDNKINKDYYWQMQGQMWVLNKDWCDYFVYYPSVKPYLFRLNKNMDDIEKLKNEIEIAKKTVLEIIDKLEN